jgi:hypothetical protein
MISYFVFRQLLRVSILLNYLKKLLPFIVSILLILSETSAHATNFFPYSLRTRGYSSWSPEIQSDTNTTGMAGATLALPSTISSAEYNPAGYAMQTGSISAQINQMSVKDLTLQPNGSPIESGQGGIGISPPPWGFSISYYSPMTERDSYNSPLTLNRLKTEVSLKEYHFTVARSFFDSKLAIGVSAEVNKAVRELGLISYNTYAMSYDVGILYRARDRLMFAASYVPRLTIGTSGEADNKELPGFNQPITRPEQVSFGAGWVPNRFFKAGTSLTYVGVTNDTALLYNQSKTTGSHPTWIPRLGASYTFAEFSNFKSELALGTYYAGPRVEGGPSRFHVTAGLEANPYFVNIGVGFDLSQDYQNIMIGVGIDIVRTLRTFKIIPKDPTPPYNGFLPKMHALSPEGLPDPMTVGDKSKSASPPGLADVGKIIQEAPNNLVKKVQGRQTTVEKKEKKEAQILKTKKKKHKKKPRISELKEISTPAPAHTLSP